MIEIQKKILKIDTLAVICFVHWVFHFLEDFSHIDSIFHILTLLIALDFMMTKEKLKNTYLKSALILNMIYTIIYIISVYMSNNENTEYIRERIQNDWIPFFIVSSSSMLAIITINVKMNDLRFDGNFYILFFIFSVFVTFNTISIIDYKLIFLEYPAYKMLCWNLQKKNIKKHKKI